MRAWSLEDEPSFRACEQCFDDWREICEGYCWKADASVLILHRQTPGTRTVLTDPASGADLFDASSLEFPFAAGPRVSLTALDREGWGFEVNYFGIDGWSADDNVPNGSLPSGSALLTVNNGAISPLTLTDAHFESISRLYSTEVNFRRPLFAGISALAGFRWLDMTDQYTARADRLHHGEPVSETITTHNHLFGFQIGADGTLAQKADCWRITGFVKGGIFLDSANQATSLSDRDSAPSPAVSASRDCAAFFGETGIVGYVELSKHLSLSGGYEIMFANGVAQPANQISGTDLTGSTATLDASSGLFYHGATAGLEVTW